MDGERRRAEWSSGVRKGFALLAAGMILLLAYPASAQVGEGFGPERIVGEQIERVPLEPLESFVERLDPAMREALPPLDLRRMIFDGEGPDWSAFGRGIARRLASEFILNAGLLGQLIVLGVFCALLRAAAVGVAGSEAADIAFLLSLLVLLLIGIGAFRTAVESASSILSQMVGFMQAILPVLSTMLAAAGAISTAAVFHPLLYAAVTGIATAIEAILFPLVYASAGLSVVGSLSKEFPVKRLAALLKTGTVSLLGLAFIAFFAVLQARGAIAPVADGFALRTAKFLTGAFIPVVGGRLADALDVVVGGSLLIKNAVGLFGMAAIAVITLFPLVKVFSLLVIFRLATALIEPITDERLVEAMSGLAGGLTLLVAGVLTAGLMFFVALTVVVAVGNVPAMAR